MDKTHLGPTSSYLARVRPLADFLITADYTTHIRFVVVTLFILFAFLTVEIFSSALNHKDTLRKSGCGTPAACITNTTP